MGPNEVIYLSFISPLPPFHLIFMVASEATLQNKNRQTRDFYWACPSIYSNLLMLKDVTSNKMVIFWFLHYNFIANSLTAIRKFHSFIKYKQKLYKQKIEHIQVEKSFNDF